MKPDLRGPKIKGSDPLVLRDSRGSDPFILGPLTSHGSQTIAIVACLIALSTKATAAQPAGLHSWPMLGGTPARNLVNTVARNIPITWDVKEGAQKNIKWVAQLGTKGYG